MITNKYDYVWLDSKGNAKSFDLIRVSGDDGACALASIYKLAGTNEVGSIARAKAVCQLKANIDDAVVRDLIKSEIRGALLSTELLYLINHTNFKLLPEELAIIDKLKSTRNQLIELAESLKNKYFQDQDLPISVGNFSYAKLFIEGKLDDYCDISLYEKLQLMEIEQAVELASKEMEELVDRKVLDYIDQLVAASGFWLGVAGKSSGVMGAIAKINRINFRVLSQDGNIHDQMPELVEIFEQITESDQEVHNLYLHTGMSNFIGVQQEGYHFDLLKENIADESSHSAEKTKENENIEIQLLQFFINHYLAKEAYLHYWNDLVANMVESEREQLLESIFINSKLNFRVWGLSESSFSDSDQQNIKQIKIIKQYGPSCEQSNSYTDLLYIGSKYRSIANKEKLNQQSLNNSNDSNPCVVNNSTEDDRVAANNDDSGLEHALKNYMN